MSTSRLSAWCPIAVAAVAIGRSRLPPADDTSSRRERHRRRRHRAKGPEAGVWVIAETSELPTKFVRIVVTDDQGRYLIPDLPKANYNVWVRGYGLVDSPKSKSAGGKTLNLTAVAAPNPRAAAAVLSGGLLVVAAQGAGQERVPGHGAERKRHSRRTSKSQARLRSHASSPARCTACHQLGTKGTREIPDGVSRRSRRATPRGSDACNPARPARRC